MSRPLRWVLIAVVAVAVLLLIGFVLFGTGGEESGPLDPGTVTR